MYMAYVRHIVTPLIIDHNYSHAHGRFKFQSYQIKCALLMAEGIVFTTSNKLS